MAYDVFVSYSNKDKTVADTIVASLEKNNIRCWYAPRDIKPGSDWGEEIAKAINETSVFLLIFSSSANRSRRVLDELNLAISKEAAILPFRIEKLEPVGAMQLHLSAIHWLDAFVPSWEKHIDQLINIVSLNLGEEAKAAIDENGNSIAPAPERKRKKSSIVVIVSAIILIGIAAIFGIPKLLNQNQDSSGDLLLQENTTDPSETFTVFNTPEPQIPALGSAENPIVWMYVPPENLEFNDVNAAAEEIAKSFGEMNDGLIIKPIPASSITSIVDALCDGGAHLGSLDAFSYLVASNRNCADVKLIWSFYEDINFGGEIFFNAQNDDIETIFDLEGGTLCIPTFNSISGWVLPSLEIRATLGDPYTHFREIIEMGSHDQVVEGVYNSDCDVGTAYNDIRKTSDLPNVMTNVEVILTTTTMPNLNFSFQSELDASLAQQLISFFLSISSNNEQLALVYGYTGENVHGKMIEINDYYYSELRNLFQRAGENPEDYYYW